MSTKERREIEIGIERFLVLFSNMWKRGAIYRDKRIGERANHCLMPTFASKKDNMKLFQTY